MAMISSLLFLVHKISISTSSAVPGPFIASKIEKAKKSIGSDIKALSNFPIFEKHGYIFFISVVNS